MYHVLWSQGKGPITHGLKSLDRFYDAMLPCPTVVLSGKDEFRIFQHYMYFSFDTAAVGLQSAPLTALVFKNELQCEKNVTCAYMSCGLKSVR